MPEILCWIADSALYRKDALLGVVAAYNWITRVPENYKEAKDLLERSDDAFCWVPLENGYKIKIDETEYESISIDTRKDLKKLTQAGLL